MEKLMMTQHRDSTAKNYLGIWRQFNRFLMNLDRKPKLWEDRTTLFIAYLVDKGVQSSSIKSYVSAIKKTLVMDKYKWDDTLVMVRSLAKACRIINDKVTTRFPIHCSLLEMLLFEAQRYFSNNNQWYLEVLYKTLFFICYYGLMRVSEVTDSLHVLKAKDVHVAAKKNKMLLVLYSSKTHDKSCRPQKIKITANMEECSIGTMQSNKHFCPFTLMRQFIQLRGDYENDKEEFFIFRDRTPVKALHSRQILKILVSRIGLDKRLYGMHSFRIGRTTDLVKLRYSIDEIKLLGRWKSNVVFKYIRP